MGPYVKPKASRWSRPTALSEARISVGGILHLLLQSDQPSTQFLSGCGDADTVPSSCQKTMRVSNPSNLHHANALALRSPFLTVVLDFAHSRPRCLYFPFL